MIGQTSGLKYSDTSLTKCAKYEYAVRAVKGNKLSAYKGKASWFVPAVKGFKIDGYVKYPKDSRMMQMNYSWKKVSGISGYEFWVSSSSSFPSDSRTVKKTFAASKISLYYIIKNQLLENTNI